MLQDELAQVPEQRSVHESHFNFVRLGNVDVLLPAVRPAGQDVLGLVSLLVDGRQLVAHGGVGGEQVGPAGAAGEVEQGDVDALPRGNAQLPGTRRPAPALRLRHVGREEPDALRPPDGATGATLGVSVRRHCKHDQSEIRIKLIM